MRNVTVYVRTTESYLRTVARSSWFWLDADAQGWEQGGSKGGVDTQGEGPGE